VSGGVVLVVFIVLMFGCHLLMMRRHGPGRDAEDGRNKRPEGGSRAHAQH
jgi:hypothetical protein